MRFVRFGALGLLLLLSLPARAIDDGSGPEAQEFDENEDSVTYSATGVTLVQVNLDSSNNSQRLIAEDAVNLSVVLGFRVPAVRSLSLEIELSTTLIPGQVKVEQCQTTTGGGLLGSPPSTTCSTSDAGDFGGNSGALYGVYRSQGKFYGVGKFGYRTSNYNIPELRDERSGTAYAGGLGYRWNPKRQAGVEITYAKFSKNIDYINFNITYGFNRQD